MDRNLVTSLALIHARALRRAYATSAGAFVALKDINLKIEHGEFVAIMGPSGSGKTTLMNILGCLARPSSGTYKLDGKDVTTFNDAELSRLRNARIGFVFQDFNLLPRLTNLANVALPLLYAGVIRVEREFRALQMLKRFGLESKASSRPTEVSGGQQQRVAIARALINDPKVLFADEPTGNLDKHTGEEILELFSRLNIEQRITIVLVTHDREVSKRTRRLVQIVDGSISYDGPVYEAA